MLELVSKELGRGIKDAGYLLIALATMVTAALGAFAQHEETKDQVAWLERAAWPILCGWFSGILYMILLVSSSPMFGFPFLKMRPE